MPEVSRFFGIVIPIFYADHQPPHFHAAYGDYEALLEIETLAVYRGELRKDWDLARQGLPLEPIAPLE